MKEISIQPIVPEGYERLCTYTNREGQQYHILGKPIELPDGTTRFRELVAAVPCKEECCPGYKIENLADETSSGREWVEAALVPDDRIILEDKEELVVLDTPIEEIVSSGREIVQPTVQEMPRIIHYKNRGEVHWTPAKSSPGTLL